MDEDDKPISLVLLEAFLVLRLSEGPDRAPGGLSSTLHDGLKGDAQRTSAARDDRLHLVGLDGDSMHADLLQSSLQLDPRSSDVAPGASRHSRAQS